jgi:HEPN domain-containing protein
MQEFKPLASVLDPDFFIKLARVEDAQTGAGRPWTIEDQYHLLDGIELHAGVPEDIRSFVNTAKNLFVFAYFHHGFYSIVAFQAASAVELALRTLFPNDKRAFKTLLKKEVVDKGLIREEGFPWLPAARAEQEAVVSALSEATGQQFYRETRPYAEVLLETLPRIRNHFAHPSYHTIVNAAMALDLLRPSVDLINQLWPFVTHAPTGL